MREFPLTALYGDAGDRNVCRCHVNIGTPDFGNPGSPKLWSFPCSFCLHIQKLGLASHSALRTFSDLLMSLSLCLSLSLCPCHSIPVPVPLFLYSCPSIPVTVNVPICLLIPVCVTFLLFLPLCLCSAVPSMFFPLLLLHVQVPVFVPLHHGFPGSS